MVRKISLRVVGLPVAGMERPACDPHMPLDGRTLGFSQGGAVIIVIPEHCIPPEVSGDCMSEGAN